MAALGVVLAGITLAGCGGVASKVPGAGGSPASAHGRATAGLSPAQAVEKVAASFMNAFVAGQPAEQWGLLTPGAQQGWPSQQARAAMLAAKFGGFQMSYSLGHPVSGAVHVNYETLARQENLWEVPVDVRFVGPQPGPAGAAALYQSLALYLAQTRGSSAFKVVGEGPASMDAPVITRGAGGSQGSAQQASSSPPVPSGPATGPLLPIVAVPAHQVTVPIFMYHRVAPLPLRSAWNNSYGWEIESGLTVPPAQFDAEMNYLHGAQYHAISITRLMDNLEYGLPLPTRPFVLTFDDGRQSPWFNAVPVLRTDGFTANFFVSSGFIGHVVELPNGQNRQGYLTGQEITTLSADGFWVEDHGVYDQVPLYDASMSVLQQQVGASAVTIEKYSGRPIQDLAYTGALWPFPAASQGQAAEAPMFADLAALGYVSAVTDARTTSATEYSTQPMALPRIRVYPGEPLQQFETDASGAV